MTGVTTASIVIFTFVDIYSKFTFVKQESYSEYHKYKYGLNRYNGYINTVLTQAIMLICPQTVTNIARTGVERNHVCTDLTAPRTGFFAFINIYITSREKAASDRDFVANTQRPASLLHICMNYSTPDFPLTLTWIGLLKLDIYRLDTD